MTEEIIIDGINVGECEHSFKKFDDWVGKDVVWCDCTLSFRCEPKENHCKFYMYYLEKQLQAKEQECEKLKKQHESDKDLITSTGKQNYQLIQECDKLKKCLTDIEEIAMCIMDDDLEESSAYCNAKQILQKSANVR